MQRIKKDTPKTLGGVDFTTYALSTSIQYVQLSRIYEVKNAVNLSKQILSSLNFTCTFSIFL